MALEYFQLVATRSPGSAGFGQEGAACVEKYITSEPLDLGTIQDAMRELVGDVDLSEFGRLKRTMPKAHPYFPWLLCRDVQLQFVGARDKDGNVIERIDADPSLYLDPITDTVANYVRAELTATFEPRVYDVIKDADVEPETFYYYLPTDGVTPTGIGIDSKEYLRFVDQEPVPNPQLFYFQLGQLVLRTNTPSDDGPDDGVQPSTFAGTPFILMPDGAFKIVWHAVPYSIFLDRTHPIYRFIAHTNQTEFFGWQPGQLLYMGATARRYVPTFPWLRQTLDGTTAFSAEKLCDITMNFNFTTREVTDPPDLQSVRGSWIPGGFNAMPWAKTRKFYTVTAPSEQNILPAEDWVPLFNSAPLALLFSCPEDG